MVPAHSHKVSRVSWYSGFCLASSGFIYGAFTLSGRSFQDLSITLFRSIIQSEPHHASTMVWALPRSLAATGGITFVFSSSGYLDVSVHRVPPAYLLIQYAVPGVCPGGLPHSDICGSLCICHSPQLFAACHVFLRLLVPRHPPCALYSLTNNNSLSGLCLASIGNWSITSVLNLALRSDTNPACAVFGLVFFTAERSAINHIYFFLLLRSLFLDIFDVLYRSYLI